LVHKTFIGGIFLKTFFIGLKAGCIPIVFQIGVSSISHYELQKD